MMRTPIALALAIPLFACSDDSAAGPGDAAMAEGDPVIWRCLCRGMKKPDAPGDPFETEEVIMECAASDPTELLSERYRMAAEAADPSFTGVCENCLDTDATCDPDEG